MNGGLNIDLHTHSNCSDGALTPAELVARAAAAGVEVLALTDHDTVAGLTEADHSAGVHGLRLVPGVEISASWRAQAIHVLGLWIDPASAELRSVLEMQAERRRARMREICARLEKLGLPGPLLLAAVEAQPGLPTRAHLANAMVAGGHVPMSRPNGLGSMAWWAGSAPQGVWPPWRIRRAMPCLPGRAGKWSPISRPPAAPRSKW